MLAFITRKREIGLQSSIRLYILGIPTGTVATGKHWHTVRREKIKK